jgi:hypothetical protein
MSDPLEFISAGYKDGHIELVFGKDGKETMSIILRKSDSYSLASDLARLDDYMLCDGYCHEFCGSES